MIEKIYAFSTTDTKNVEKIIDDDPLQLNHMVLPKDSGMPEHYSNSNVYIIVARGRLTIRLEDQELHQYHGGQVINIPFNTKMKIDNFDEEILEFFVVKSPNPRNYQE